MNTWEANWIANGKRLTRNNGYLCFYDRHHPLADPLTGRVFVHRYLAAKMHGRRLREGQIVYFQDGNPENISPDNLAVATRKELIQRRPRRVVQKVCQRCRKRFIVPMAHKARRCHCSVQCAALDRRLFEVTAEDLRELVWALPTTDVARLFGVSDKAIEKRCKRLGIAKPPRGYWTKHSNNEKHKEKSYHA
jgi:hypothetical protein